MAAVDSLLEQAMQLPDEERGRLALRLLLTLEPDDGDELTGTAWELAWSEEIDRRLRDVDNDSELVEGDQVLADARTWLAAQRR